LVNEKACDKPYSLFQFYREILGLASASLFILRVRTALGLDFWGKLLWVCGLGSLVNPPKMILLFARRSNRFILPESSKLVSIFGAGAIFSSEKITIWPNEKFTTEKLTSHKAGSRKVPNIPWAAKQKLFLNGFQHASQDRVGGSTIKHSNSVQRIRALTGADLFHSIENPLVGVPAQIQILLADTFTGQSLILIPKPFVHLSGLETGHLVDFIKVPLLLGLVLGPKNFEVVIFQGSELPGALWQFFLVRFWFLDLLVYAKN
jgi:hypothetical protein